MRLVATETLDFNDHRALKRAMKRLEVLHGEELARGEIRLLDRSDKLRPCVFN